MFLVENSWDRLDFSWTMKTSIWDRKTSFPDLLSLGKMWWGREAKYSSKGQEASWLPRGELTLT